MGKKARKDDRSPEEIALAEKRREEFKEKILARKAKMEARGTQRGVILLSHIPLGFYEPQMFEYFSQFGKVTRLKLVRSRKTGRSRHFAFIEFQFEEVARIAAKTMHNYLMYQKILKCQLIPLEDVRPSTFKNWRIINRVPQTRRKAIKMHNLSVTDPKKVIQKILRACKRRRQLQKKLQELDIDYDVINIKVNESFIAPERTRASPEEIADVYEPIPDSIGMEDRYSDADDDSDMDESPIEHIETLKKRQSKEIEGTDFVSQDENKTISGVTKSSITDEDESGFGVMVVDLEDTEVTFKSPPSESKIRRKSVGVSKASSLKKSSKSELKPITEMTKKSSPATPMSAKERRILRIQKLELALNSPEENDVKERTSRKKSMNNTATPHRQTKRKMPKTDKKQKSKSIVKTMNRTM